MSKYIIGIDLGGTNIKAGIVEESSGMVIVSESIKTLSNKGMDDTFNRIVELIDKMLKDSEINKDKISGVGMGIPGPVINFETVTFFANFPWEKGKNVAKILEEKIGLPVKLGNDANVITLGEAWKGGAKGYKNVLGLTLGTGIGGGILIDGKILEGFRGAGAEVGHMKLVENGKLCGCGQKGCWEAYGSATAIVKETIDRFSENNHNLVWKNIDGNVKLLEAKHVFDAAKENDRFANGIVDYTANYLAMGIGNLLNVLNPEIIIIGGGVALAGDYLFDKIKEELTKFALPVSLENIKIAQASLGEDAGIVGAAALFNA